MPVLSHFQEHPTLLRCPACRGPLEARLEGSGGPPTFTCTEGGHVFPVEDGIPLLYWPTKWDASKPDVTDQVRAFYEETPFPNYDGFDTVGSLVEKAGRGLFAAALDRSLPPGIRVLEVGCGTGQLSIFLSAATRRTVVGADLCLNSLRMGEGFARENQLHRVHFMQMNLFRPALAPESFDVVISNGVLHHTADPRLALASIGGLVKPGGYLLVGLYHRIGRLLTDTRRAIFRSTGNRLTFLDPNLRGRETDGKFRAWLMDQYHHPHESKHTIGETAGWMEEEGFRFVRSIPGSHPSRPFTGRESLLAPEPRPRGALGRWGVELSTLRGSSRQGGFFIVIGRKTPAPSNPVPGSSQTVPTPAQEGATGGSQEGSPQKMV